MTSHDDEEPEYLTISEAARISGFSVRTIGRWIEQERIPTIVISGETLVARHDLEAILSRSKTDEPETNETDP